MKLPRYDAENLPAEGWDEYRKLTVTKAVQMTHAFEVETLEGTMRGKAGDYLCIDTYGNPYPCDQFVFAAQYAKIRREAA